MESRPQLRPQRRARAVPSTRSRPGAQAAPSSAPRGAVDWGHHPQGAPGTAGGRPCQTQTLAPPEPSWGGTGGVRRSLRATGWSKGESRSYLGTESRELPSIVDGRAEKRGGKRGRRTEVWGARSWFPERTDGRARGQRRADWDRCRDTLRPGWEALRAVTAGRSPPGRPSDPARETGQSCSPLPCSCPSPPKPQTRLLEAPSEPSLPLFEPSRGDSDRISLSPPSRLLPSTSWVQQVSAPKFHPLSHIHTLRAMPIFPTGRAPVLWLLL